MRTLVYSLAFFLLRTVGIFCQTEIHLRNGCSFDDVLTDEDLYAFEPSDEADRIVTEIMVLHSLPKNFVLRASNVPNALATTDPTSGQRFILYNTSFLEKFKTDANTRWAAYSVLAHEIGHHLSGHNFDDKDPRRRKRMELEADRFAGGTLCLLGSTLIEAQAVFNTFTVDSETTTHPAKSSRLEAIASEWKKKNEWMIENGVKPNLPITSVWKANYPSDTSVVTRCHFCPEMVSVRGTANLPGGRFRMGSEVDDTTADADEKPAHSVAVQDFEIGKFEVTNRDFCTFLNEKTTEIILNSEGAVSIGDQIIFDLYCSGQAVGGCLSNFNFSEQILYDNGTVAGGEFSVNLGCESQPVVMVTWYGAKAYIIWLNKKTGFNTMKGYRLPTEAEWEYAARGGTLSKRYKYSGSNDPTEVAWYDFNSNRKSQPIGGKKANEIGIYDMSGNVCEWTEDCYSNNYIGHPRDGSAKVESADCFRVIRGGSWGFWSGNVLVAKRSYCTPACSTYTYGFRLAKSK